VPDRVQIDTTLNRQNPVQNHAVTGRRSELNRTAVNGADVSISIAWIFPFLSLVGIIFGTKPCSELSNDAMLPEIRKYPIT
jgi:hypothetical protein